VDSSVILDVITDDQTWAPASAVALRQAMQEGCLVLCECVVAEIMPAISPEDWAGFVEDWKIQFIPSSLQSAIAAGRMFEQHLSRRGEAKRIVADFLIAAHALYHADRLLARDRGYYRDYFKDLDLVQP
jgi:predicted nucleic acid-binding protein